MKALVVDLRSRPAPPRWAWGLVGLLFLVAAGLGLAAYREWTVLKVLKAERQEFLRQAAIASQPPPVTPPQKMPYDASAREMLALATSEWPAMLSAFESAEVAGVQSVALELVAAERWIRIEVKFSDYRKLLEYIDALNAGEPKPKWNLVEAQAGSRLSSEAPGTGSSATIRGAW